MEHNDSAKLVYLSVLAATILGAVLISHRGNLKNVFRNAGLWLLIFASVIIITASFQEFREQNFITSVKIGGDGTITIPREEDGHFRLTLKVNDTPVKFLVDTGASDIVLTRQDAAKIGFNTEKLDYWDTAKTANGVVGIAILRLAKVQAGIFSDRNIRASVNQGSMETSLLGMHYLKLFSSIEIKKDKMILKR